MRLWVVGTLQDQKSAHPRVQMRLALLSAAFVHDLVSRWGRSVSGQVFVKVWWHRRVWPGLNRLV